MGRRRPEGRNVSAKWTDQSIERPTHEHQESARRNSARTKAKRGHFTRSGKMKTSRPTNRRYIAKPSPEERSRDKAHEKRKKRKNGSSDRPRAPQVRMKHAEYADTACPPWAKRCASLYPPTAISTAPQFVDDHQRADPKLRKAQYSWRGASRRFPVANPRYWPGAQIQPTRANQSTNLKAGRRSRHYLERPLPESYHRTLRAPPSISVLTR